MPAEDFVTVEFHQDTGNCNLMLRFIAGYIPQNALTNLKQGWSYKALQSELVQPTTATLPNHCQWEYSLTVVTTINQLLFSNTVMLAVEGWTSTNAYATTLVLTSYLDPDWRLSEVHHMFNEVGSLFIFIFQKKLHIICQRSLYWSKPGRVLGGSS